MPRWVTVGGAAVLITWIAAVTAFIALEPPRGAATPEDLGQKLQEAVMTQDSSDLTPIIDPDGYPQEASDAFLASVKQGCDPLGQVAVASSAGERGSLALHRKDGSLCGRLNAVHKEDGRWYLDANLAWTGSQ